MQNTGSEPHGDSNGVAAGRSSCPSGQPSAARTSDQLDRPAHSLQAEPSECAADAGPTLTAGPLQGGHPGSHGAHGDAAAGAGAAADGLLRDAEKGEKAAPSTSSPGKERDGADGAQRDAAGNGAATHTDPASIMVDLEGAGEPDAVPGGTCAVPPGTGGTCADAAGRDSQEGPGPGAVLDTGQEDGRPVAKAGGDAEMLEAASREEETVASAPADAERNGETLAEDRVQTDADVSGGAGQDGSSSPAGDSGPRSKDFGLPSAGTGQPAPVEPDGAPGPASPAAAASLPAGTGEEVRMPRNRRPGSPDKVGGWDELGVWGSETAFRGCSRILVCDAAPNERRLCCSSK
jgi:hypothetical protein